MNNKYWEHINELKEECLREGKKHEKYCAKLFEKYGYETSKSSNYHDFVEHWDYLVKKDGKKARVEMKGLKDAHLHGYTWLEETNVKTDVGWLYGMGDVLSVETEDYIYVYLMKGLRELFEKMVDKSKPILISKPKLKDKEGNEIVDYEYMRFRIYDRRGDRMTIVSFDDIEEYKIFTMKKII